MGAVSPGLPAVLAALGIGVNVAFVGLHAWLPDTYPRPHVAASVFLSVYTTKTGVDDVAPLAAVPLLGLAALCVVFGLAPGVLFGLVDGTGALASDAKPYSTSHLTKGLVVGAGGAVAFLVLRRPLKLVGRLPDVDTVYNPAALVLTRALLDGIGGIGSGTVRVRRLLAGAWSGGADRLLPGVAVSTDVGRAMLVVSTVLVLALLVTLS